MGPGHADQCLQNAIAKCECEVLQQPGAVSGLVRSSSTSDVGFNDPNDLIPALVRTICLTRDEDGAYLLTVLMPQTKAVLHFLNFNYGCIVATVLFAIVVLIIKYLIEYFVMD